MSNDKSKAPNSQKPTPRSGDTYRTMIAGAMSGSLARIVSHPLDTIKSQMQVNTGKGGHGVTSSIRRIVSSTGVRGLYAGFGASFFGAAPATCLYFTAYDWFKRHSPISSSPIASELAAGFLAETLSCVLWVPIDVVKERLQVQSLLQQSRNISSAATATTAAAAATATAGTSSVVGSTSSAAAVTTRNVHTTPSSTAAPAGLLYRGNWDAIRTIARNEGLRGIYRGYGATLLSYGPFSALYLTGADQLERWSRQRLGLAAGAELPWYAHLACGTIASSAAAYITTPLDLAKLRIQVQRGPLGFTFGYVSLADGLTKIWRHEGIAGLWRGSGARLASMAPMCSLTWSLNGIIKERLQHIDL